MTKMKLNVGTLKYLCFNSTCFQDWELFLKKKKISLSISFKIDNKYHIKTGRLKKDNLTVACVNRSQHKE